jgi:hypothetical protein
MKKIVPELPGAGRLGRHVEHDERSRSFAAPAVGPIVSRAWERHCPPFQQGDLGSCTGNALGGVLMTGPFYKPDRIITEEDCVRLYSHATRLDKIPGHYPPEDTGSSGLAVCKAAAKAGLIKSYRHAFALNAVLAALGRGPLIVGINWYAGFDKPQGDGAQLVIGGGVRGGHEVELLAIDVERKLVRGPNSWGLDFGDHGYFTMSFATLERLLGEDGDATVPTPL